MDNPQSFRSGMRRDLNSFVKRQEMQLGGNRSEDVLKIDLHCHDRNSDVPDETLGRILRIRETWLPTAKLLRTLKANGADALTITNHNNARSCWQAMERGEDILSGAEFSCTLPDLEIGVHVLTFGFTPEHEPKLNKLRKDLYGFLEFTAAENIPTVLAHPLHFYSPKGLPPLELMDRFAVLFERFEGVNGQRDAWQNLLTLTWVEGLDEESIEAAGKRAGMKPGAFSRNPYVKRITGGSDCHMGIFSGSTGTRLHIPDWRNRKESKAQLALEALRNSDMGPYGSHCEEEKLTVAFLDFFCQVALHMEDPGLLRLLLHKGTTTEKLQALAIANGMFELRRHRYTSRFLGLFHECLQGRKPGWFTSLMTSQDYKPLLLQMEAIAMGRAKSPEELVSVLRSALPAMFDQLTTLLTDRIKAKVKKMESKGVPFSTSDLIEKIELPTHFRSLFGLEAANTEPGEGGIDVGKLSDGLPFPALAAGILGGAAFAASKVLYGDRPFLQEFSKRLGRYEHPKRALWLTDTLQDKNGVSHVLQSMLGEARRRNLPVDFLACSHGKDSDPMLGSHLNLMSAVSEFTLPFYQEQIIRLPGMLELQKTFLEGGYDRIVCSTEAPMGLFALYLKSAFNVPAYFYMHTDWLDFARRTLKFDKPKLDRLRRFLRAFYRRFDGIFLLNTEQKDYFSSPEMGISPDRLFLTAHWTDSRFYPREVTTDSLFKKESDQGPVIFYAGRLSEEKGVMDLPAIFHRIKSRIPNARLAFAGTGPCQEDLKSACPEASFLGWLAPDQLAQTYSQADLLLLPSWFDTFSCSLLEALSCGLPAIAFNTNGPRDILSEGRGGLLAEGTEEMSEMAIALLENPDRLESLSALALRRAADFNSETIFNGLLSDIGLRTESSKPARKKRSALVDSNWTKSREKSLHPNQAFIGELLAMMQPE